MGSYTDFAVAWQEYASSATSSIKYCYLQDCNNSFIQFDTTQNTVSNNSYPNNHNPSITILNDGSVRVCWIGDYGNGQWIMTHTLERDPSTSTIFVTGAGTQSVTMNRTNNAANFYFAFSENINGTWSNLAIPGSNLYTGGQNLNTTGQNVQMCNGSTSSNMYVSSYYPFTLPYYFQLSQSMGSALGLNAAITENSVSIKP